MKKERQDKIKEIIEKYHIDTQDELIKRLRESGFSATQATMSRDMREMKLIKVADSNNGYRYAFPQKISKEDSNFIPSLVHFITDIDYAINMVVIKTKGGMAQAVATKIDAINDANILGCVAGDDTIFICTRSEDSASKLSMSVKSQME